MIYQVFQFMRSLRNWVIILIVAIFTVSCTPTVPSQSPLVVNTLQAKATEVKPANTSKVVALTSLSADIIYRLDKTKLVGIPGSRLLRENTEMSKLPQVSEGQTPPNLEKIIALKPDLVIGATGFHDQVLAKLKELGIRTMTSSITSWQSLEELTTAIATEIQADPTALIKSYETLISTKATKPESTLVLVSSQPILAPNKNSWAGDLLTKFQIENAAAELQGQSPQKGYITLSAEKVLETNPKVLILVDFGDGAINKLKEAPFWNKLDAVKGDRVYTLGYYGLVNPGSLDAIAKACTQLQAIVSAKV
ncbi:molybdenum transport ATP-binding protein ModC / Molybdenum transport system permease protein ModB [Pseudanabaena sp. lw0831]|uniref:ABC transporter substrate-binding protein n=1 Tax=Pseudanabaena sp. lw0831 TaxID=1357935 RepID=UPI001A28BE65|nr:ABC transporter substrate-binding protein [Pseudanabaena sp. lw0831]GBO54473.1 molybdenum transport ATP-binding protein ModC / Molybdenum transport system permease protein ModB [Pseudanabaena sp. lw0831]